MKAGSPSYPWTDSYHDLLARYGSAEPAMGLFHGSDLCVRHIYYILILMSMAWAEGELRRTGDPADAICADILRALIASHGDVPLPPADQVSDVAEPGVRPSLAAGRLAVPRALTLRTAATDLMLADPHALTAEQTHLGQLWGRIREVADPYERLFKAQTPSVEQNKRTMLLRRVKEGEPGDVDWQYVEITDDMTLTYDFNLAYRQGRAFNQLQEVIMRMKSQHDPEIRGNPAPQLRLKFSDNSLTGLSLSWRQAHPVALLKKTAGTSLEGLLNSNFVFNNDWQDHGVIEAKLGDKPTLVLCQQFTPYVHARVSGVTAESRFLYRASDDHFTRQTRDVALHQRLGLADQQILTNDQFISIIYDLLQLIPTVPDTQLYQYE